MIDRFARHAAVLALVVAAVAWPTQAQETTQIYLTYYVIRGTTYSGTVTRPGVAACGWDMELGTRVRFADGFTVVCEDRGGLVRYRHVDVWQSSDAAGRALIRTYGEHPHVEVLPP